MLVQEHVGAAALNHVAGRIVHGAAVEGDLGQKRAQQVRHTGNFAQCQAKLDFFEVATLHCCSPLQQQRSAG